MSSFSDAPELTVTPALPSPTADPTPVADASAAAATVSALALATSTAVPGPPTQAPPAQCPAVWSLQADGSAERSVRAQCPMALAPTVLEAMARWTFRPVTAPTQAEATFYLYDAKNPTWLVADPKQVVSLPANTAKPKLWMTPRVTEGILTEASCTVEVHVDVRGRVYFVEVVDCPEALQRGAVDAAYGSTFYPHKDASGSAVAVRFPIRYTFKVK